MVLKLSTYTNLPFCVPVKHSNQKPGLLVDPTVTDPTPIPHHVGSLDTPILLSTTSTSLAHTSGMYYHPHRLCCVFPAPNAFPYVLSARVIELTPLNPFKINERSTMPAARLGCSEYPHGSEYPNAEKIRINTISGASLRATVKSGNKTTISVAQI